ncbi:hypothetical protein [Tenacibaculum geojense]|uniref:Glutaminyl-tRNA synthetase n=1 Tax=Tenacibaculum geojense TaxID=915352 RepID=A0ABW3JQJ9_9FLAO
MTRRFKKTVRSAVLDGVITPEEKAILKKVAKEENVSDIDAEVYIMQELKKQKAKNNKRDSWFSRNSSAIINTLGTLGGIVLTAFIKGKK